MRVDALVDEAEAVADGSGTRGQLSRRQGVPASGLRALGPAPPPGHPPGGTAGDPRPSYARGSPLYGQSGTRRTEQRPGHRKQHSRRPTRQLLPEPAYRRPVSSACGWPSHQPHIAAATNNAPGSTSALSQRSASFRPTSVSRLFTAT
ncbi:hypothetical protein GCM10009647_074130 [Streptomyces sanglieri]|uniref:Uncharacterized protein n=1 Tax=Streptomyces sanglieri TaxID=193460 RepID=A0ABW2XB19_9ACTN